MFKFLGEVKNELSKVVWPTRKETLTYTVVVIIFSVTVSFVLGAFDYGLLKAFEALLK